MRAGRYAELQLPVIEALHRYEIGLAELPARTVRRCGTEWTFARIGEVTSGADHIFLSVDMDVLDPAHAPGDRKSTRLNSSHGSISYAVFCLKKKKTRVK